jgi:hypothetical protein
MKNKAVIEITIEALEARGFSKAESTQIPLTTIDKDEIKPAYDRRFEDGKQAYFNEIIKRQDEAIRRAREQTQSSPLYSGLGGLGSGIFGGIFGK